MRRVEPRRCAWCGDDPLLIEYHDTEWGVPSTDDRHLFELLTLEGAQAGLSWITILKKRDGYRAAFAGFDVEKVARFDARRMAALRDDARIVRNRAKIESTVGNARAVQSLREEGRTLNDSSGSSSTAARSGTPMRPATRFPPRPRNRAP